MSESSIWLKRFLLAFIPFILSASVSAAGKTTEAAKSVKKIRWLVAHNPGNQAVNDLLESFSNRIALKSGGSLKLELLAVKNPDDDIDSIAHGKVLSGKAEMSQVKTIALEKHNPQIAALDMPFLFRSYEHSDAVLRGPIAKELLDGVYEGSKHKVRALAFTYSGGYRILHGRVAIKEVSDLKKYRMWERNNRIRVAFLKELGIKFVKDKARRGQYSEPHASDEIDLNEGELNRLAVQFEKEKATRAFVKFANLTHHNMYLTSIIVNEKFFAGLNPEQRKLLDEEIQELAIAERKLSIDLEKANRIVLAEKGVQLVELPTAEREKMVAIGETVHKKFASELGGTVEKIRSVTEVTLEKHASNE